MIKYFIFQNETETFKEVSKFLFYAQLRVYKDAKMDYTIENRVFHGDDYDDTIYERKEKRLFNHIVA